LLLIPALNLKATLAQTTQNQPSSSLIILKKSPVIIVTGNTMPAQPSVRLKVPGSRRRWEQMGSLR
jgi:hypothetical protein